MSWLTKIIGINCRNVTALSDKKVHVGLSPIEQSKLSFHLLMCDGCRNYLKQARILDKILKEKIAKMKSSENIVPNEDLKLR
ncbi:MAG: hypothetical protein NT150_03235, partial [Bacteroidetes bacterium]|nr:hypothetical protein [Bacteroidota bacterium]